MAIAETEPSIKAKTYLRLSCPLKLTTTNYHQIIWYETLHNLNKRAIPNQISSIQTCPTLHKVYNNKTMSLDWTNLFFNQHFNVRKKLSIFSMSPVTRKEPNRFVILNGQIKYDCLNKPLEAFILKCKSLFWSKTPQKSTNTDDVKRLFKYKAEESQSCKGL